MQTATAQNLPLPDLKDFFEAGAAFIQSMKTSGKDPCQAISPDSKEWLDWGAYFLERYGKVPVSFRDIERAGKGTFTVPAQWPQWFDRTYAPGQTTYRPARRAFPEKPTPEMIERAERLRLAFKRGLTKREHIR